MDLKWLFNQSIFPGNRQALYAEARQRVLNINRNQPSLNSIVQPATPLISKGMLQSRLMILRERDIPKPKDDTEE